MNMTRNVLLGLSLGALVACSSQGGIPPEDAGDEAVDTDTDEEEQDEAASDGSDEHGAAAASSGVHPGVLPDMIRITRQVHHTTQGDSGGFRRFRGARFVQCGRYPGTPPSR